jgi:hypothetical protein
MSDDTPDDDQDSATITIEIRREMMENSRYSVLVRRSPLGQLRIQLSDAALPEADPPALHGAIVRELCTTVAERFEKRHDNALRDIDALILR